VIEHRLTDFTSHPDYLNRDLSAGFLARCLALMRGIAALGGADLDDLCAVLARVLLEDCLLGLYVLLGGIDALNDVMGDYQRNVKLFADRNDDETLNELVAEWDRATDRVNLEQAAKKPSPIIRPDRASTECRPPPANPHAVAIAERGVESRDGRGAVWLAVEGTLRSWTKGCRHDISYTRMTDNPSSST
jgi:hypothetical protein